MIILQARTFFFGMRSATEQNFESQKSKTYYTPLTYNNTALYEDKKHTDPDRIFKKSP
jgi:hypothetical protein